MTVVLQGPGQREGGPTVHGVIEGGSMLSSPFNFGGSSSMATSNTVQPPGSAPLSTFAFGTFGVDLKPSGSNTLGPAYSVAPPVFTPGNAVTSFSGTAQPLNAGAITSSSFSTGQASFGASTCSSFQSAVMTSAPQAFFGTSGSKSNTSFFGCQTSNVVGITSAVVGFGQQPQEVGCGPSSNVFRFGSTSNSKPESAGSILFGSQSGLPNTLQAQTNPFGGPLTHDTQGSTSAFSFGVEQQNPSSHLVQQQSNQPVGFTMGGGEVLQQGARRVVKARRRLRGK